jgi:sulfur-oxidizing protein SoxY
MANGNKGLSRRGAMKVAAVAASGVAGLATPSVAQVRLAPTVEAGAFEAAIARVVGDAKVKKGRVKLDIPPLVENGNTVPCTVTVESPMTQADHVKAIHVFCEKNPQPNVIAAQLGSRAGRAVVSTRIRLSDTQNVTAIAELSDGSFWSDSTHVVITLGACLEGDLI